MFRKISFVFIIVLMLFSTACDSALEGNTENGDERVRIEQLESPKPDEKVAIMTTSMGEIKIRFFPDVAPKAVENFLTHAENGYYDGVLFHRVINDFMIQGGDPQGNGTGGESIWGSPFEDEFDDLFCHFRGALSMANRGANTNGSQFFIVQNTEVPPETLRAAGQSGAPKEVVEAYYELGGTPHLDGRHTVFAQVYEGMDVVDKIAETQVDRNDKPIEEVKIISIQIKTFE